MAPNAMKPEVAVKSAAPRLSVIIPALNEIGELGATLAAVARARARASYDCEVIVVDGGSDDGTAEWAESQDGVIARRASAGRALQLNAGAEMARAPWLFFLHADSHPDRGLLEGLAPRLGGPRDKAYTFRLKLRGPAPIFRFYERGVEWRCRKLGLAYGDQGMCIHRSLFASLGGFRTDADMEDLDFVLRLRGRGGLEMLPFDVRTSTRQWQTQGELWGTVHNLGRLCAGVTLHYLRGEGRKTGSFAGGESGADHMGKAEAIS